MTDKPALRAQLQIARAAAAAAAERRPLAVPDAFAARLAPGRTVASYVPIESEIDPAPLESAALAAGCRLALPHVTGRAEPIRFLAWSAQAPLQRGPFGLRQPAADAAELVPDIILTPLLGFDRAGNRLGWGAGHYDRAFAAHPDAWRVGVAWSAQEIAGLVPDPWDVPLHAILTEREWILP